MLESVQAKRDLQEIEDTPIEYQPKLKQLNKEESNGIIRMS